MPGSAARLAHRLALGAEDLLEHRDARGLRLRELLEPRELQLQLLRAPLLVHLRVPAAQGVRAREGGPKG